MKQKRKTTTKLRCSGAEYKTMICNTKVKILLSLRQPCVVLVVARAVSGAVGTMVASRAAGSKVSIG